MSEPVTRKEVDELKQNFAEIVEIGKKRVDTENKNGTDLQEYKEEQTKAAEDFITKFDELNKKQEDEVKEIKEKNIDLEKAIANMTPANGDGEDGLSQKSLDMYNMYIKHANQGASSVDMANAPLVKSAFDKLVCCKESLLTVEEKTVINSIIDPQGGYATAPQYDNTLINKKFDLRGVLDLVEVKNVTAGEYSQTVDNADYDSAEYLNELANTDPTEHDANYDVVKWNATEQIFKMRLTRTEIEDSFIQGGIENDLIGKARSGIIRKTGAQVVIGNGVDRPRGILTYSSGTTYDTIEQITSGSAGILQWEDVINVLPSELGDSYHESSAYAMNRRGFFELLVDKDSTGQLKLMNQINFFSRDGVTMSIMGRPVKFDAGIPTVAAGALSVIFGDFKEAYALVERIGFSIIIDNVTSGQVVTYRFRRRNDGRLKMGNALKILKIKS